MALVITDDSNLAKEVPLESVSTVFEQISDCTQAIEKWMHSQMLKPNMEKTELLIVGTRQRLRK